MISPKELCPGSGAVLSSPKGKPGWLGSKGICPVCNRSLATTLGGRSWHHKRPDDLAPARVATQTERIEALEKAVSNTVTFQTLVAMFDAHNKNLIEPLHKQSQPWWKRLFS
jgi:hypothetical protein